MKKKLLLLSLFVFFGLNHLSPLTAHAQEVRQLAQETDPAVLNPINPVTNEQLEELDPLSISGSANRSDFAQPAGIVNRLLLFAFPLAGLILFLMIVWGGFEMLAKSATKKSMDSGKQRITSAIIGFLLLFASFWIVQIMEIMFGVQIL